MLIKCGAGQPAALSVSLAALADEALALGDTAAAARYIEQAYAAADAAFDQWGPDRRPRQRAPRSEVAAALAAAA